MVRRLSLHGGTVGWRPGWPGLARLAAEAGYDGVVLPRDALAGRESPPTPIPVTAMPVPVEVRRDESTFEAGLPNLEQAVRFGASLGCKIAVVGLPPSSDRPKKEQAQIYLHRLRTCVETFDRYGIRLALEAISPLHLRRAKPYEFIWRTAEMLDFARLCSPDAGVVADCWHWHHAGETAEDLISLGPDAILDVHISDAPAIPGEEIRDMERLLPGEGVINFPGFFGALKAVGYSGTVTVEVFSGRLQNLTPEEAARSALDAARGVLARIRDSQRAI